MRLFSTIALCALIGAGAARAQVVAPPDPDPLPPPAQAPNGRYAAKGWADRIVLSPGADAAREMAVAWRTDTRQTSAQAQIALDIAGPLLDHAARTVTGRTLASTAENGPANHHHVRFTDLTPGRPLCLSGQGRRRLVGMAALHHRQGGACAVPLPLFRRHPERHSGDRLARHSSGLPVVRPGRPGRSRRRPGGPARDQGERRRIRRMDRGGRLRLRHDPPGRRRRKP